MIHASTTGTPPVWMPAGQSAVCVCLYVCECLRISLALCTEAATRHRSLTDAPSGSLSATTACGGEAGQLRGPAESLRFLADGVAAVRPATEAEEEIKRKEKLVRERMNTQVPSLPF